MTIHHPPHPRMRSLSSRKCIEAVRLAMAAHPSCRDVQDYGNKTLLSIESGKPPRPIASFTATIITHRS